MSIPDYQSDLLVEELSAIREFVDCELCIDTEIFNQLGASAFWVTFAVFNEDLDDGRYDKHCAALSALLETHPKLPARSLLLIGVAYTSLLFVKICSDANLAEEDVARSLLAATELRVNAVALFRNRHSLEAKTKLSEQHEVRTLVGKKGGQARSQKYQPLKDWVRKSYLQSPTSNKTATERARWLMRVLPPEIARVANDPERIVREQLRMLQNGKTTGS
jgi:hypothetical protein